MLSITFTFLLFFLLFTYQTYATNYDYTITIFKDKNFQGPHLIWNGNFGECGKGRATYADLTNDTLSPDDAYATGIQFGGFYVGSVTLPVGGVGCSVYTTDPLCVIDSYKLKYTESDINPSTADGAEDPNIWMSWKCWPCEYCGVPGSASTGDSDGGEASKNNTLVYDNQQQQARSENDETYGKFLTAKRAAAVRGSVSEEPAEEEPPAAPEDERAASPKGGSSSGSSPKSKSKTSKPAHDRCIQSNSTICSSAESLVPIRKLLGVVLGAGILASSGV